MYVLLEVATDMMQVVALTGAQQAPTRMPLHALVPPWLPWTWAEL